MAGVRTQVHRSLRADWQRGQQGSVARVHAVRRVRVAADPAVSAGVPVQRALPHHVARPRLQLPVRDVHRELSERSARLAVSRRTAERSVCVLRKIRIV